MTSPDHRHARHRLDSALGELAVVFRGMTARPDETNCTCHWGDAEELALLKTPDVELGPDLLRRTWRAPDWRDHAAVLRRILPQFAFALAGGRIESWCGAEEIGRCLARGRWQDWPAEQAASVGEFLRAWWACSLVDPDPIRPAHELLVLNVEATGTLDPWLDVWQALDHPVADRHLAEAVAAWEYDLLGDQLPWSAWEREEELRAGLTAWLLGHARTRLRAHGAPAYLLHRIRLLGVTGPDRWDDPHWPGPRY